jgi:hypothetical protein
VEADKFAFLLDQDEDKAAYPAQDIAQQPGHIFLKPGG